MRSPICQALTPALGRAHAALLEGQATAPELARRLGTTHQAAHDLLIRLERMQAAAHGPQRHGPSGRRLGRVWIAIPTRRPVVEGRWRVLRSLQRLADCGPAGACRRVRGQASSDGLYADGDLTPRGYACLWVGTAARRLTAPVALAELADLAGVDTIEEAADAVAYLRLEALIRKERP